MTLSTGLRNSLAQSGIGYKAKENLYTELGLIDTRVTAQETSNPTEVAVTATADGLTTGLVPATASYVTVTCANAAHIVTLPTAAVGKRIVMFWGATAGHVRTAATSNITINGTDADGGAADAGVPASHLVVFTKVSATGWITSAVTAAGAAYTVLVA